MKSKNISLSAVIGLALIIVIIYSCEGLDDLSHDSNLEMYANRDSKKNELIRYTNPAMSSEPLIEFIVDEKNKNSVTYNNEIKKACDYTKLPFRPINIKKWNTDFYIYPSTKVLSLYDTKELNNASIIKLIVFVSGGGTLFIPFANEDHRMAFLFGFKTESEFLIDYKSSGWYFSLPLLPNMKGKSNTPRVIHYGFAASNFSKKINILATALNNKQYPAVIENKIGNGRVILFNTSTIFQKSDRGFLFSGILKGLEGMPYPVANVATLFLDDFPSPLYNIQKEPIASEMNLTMLDFVKNIWWPDMLTLGKEYNIKYSAMTIFDYTNRVHPPFTLEQWKTNTILYNKKLLPVADWLLREVKKNGNEIAFHGYNHVSLTTDNWKEQQFIGTSLSTVKKKWRISEFGDLPSSYVPPSNIIDKKGLIELKKAMPSLKYMCSLYLGETFEGGNREFDYDPYNKEFFDFPRISNGYYIDDDHRYNKESLYLFTGIWTHFVHPDDVFQIPSEDSKNAGDFDLRNGLGYGWYKTKGQDKAMYPEFKKYLNEVTTAFPQMRFLSANDAAQIVIKWRAAIYSHKTINGIYNVEELNPDKNTQHYWFMYCSALNTIKIESQLKNQRIAYTKTPLLDGYLFSISTETAKVSIIDLHFFPNKNLQAEINKHVISEYNKYLVAVKKIQQTDPWVDNTEKNFKIELATLKNKMLNEKVIDSTVWNKYAKYMSWDNKGVEMWQTYDHFIHEHPSRANIMYSKELDRLIGYPNDLIRQRWMEAQIDSNPNDKELLKNYLDSFASDENENKVVQILKYLVTIDNSAANYKNYVMHLLLYQPEEAVKELQDKSPIATLKESATSIAWLFADGKQYQKAFDWSALCPEFDFVTKMNWLIELKQFELLEKEYLSYIAVHPNDDKAKVVMSAVYHDTGRFKQSWILANSINKSEEKDELKKMLNIDIEFENVDVQEYLILHESELFNPGVMQRILKENRLTKGNFIDLLSSLETNQADKSLQKNILSYNFNDKKSNLHTFSATCTNYYKQEIKENYTQNYDNFLIGAQYKFKSAEKENNVQYWSKARIEFDKTAAAYYQFGIGMNLSKNKKYKSAEFNLFPTETAPAINGKIYQLRLNLYQDFHLFKFINTSISLQGDYYTNGLLSKDTITQGEFGINNFVDIYDDAYEGLATLRLLMDKGDVKKLKWIPFLEGMTSQGSFEQPDGFPYWMIKHRLYGGGGLGWEFKISNFDSRLEAGYFFDDYSKEFKRLGGNLSYQVFDFTAITANFELFSQAKYYSNFIQFGLKYNVKKRLKK